MPPISSSGKSVLIYRNHVKPQNKKYFAFTEDKIRLHLCHPVPPEGRIMIARIVGTGRGGRW
jgi:hypothetical protein